MKNPSTTRMSSKGQVVIPEEIRNKLGLSPGSQFIVLGEDDVVILKAVSRPSMRDFDPLIKKARREAKAAGMTRTDVADAIKKVRGRR